MKPITQLAHELLATHAKGSLAIDATAGNGHDTLFLANLVGPTGTVWAFDIQSEALRKTAARLCEHQVPVELRLKSASPAPAGENHSRVVAIEANHAELARHLPVEARGRVAAIMFNLGYLPGADKSCITTTASTLAALDAAIEFLAPLGVLTVVVYPGHAGGQSEADAVRGWFALKGQQPDMGLLTNTESTTQTGPQLLALQRRPLGDSEAGRASGAGAAGTRQTASM
ncbi:MAG: class I SAM-dependent methyltransferase [Planctomycetaceae bacterium]